MKKLELDILANDENWLYQKYIIELRSLRSIAKECNVSDDTIRTRLNKFGIKIRDHKETVKCGYYNVPHKKNRKISKKI
jgi:hypothetical protein